MTSKVLLIVKGFDLQDSKHSMSEIINCCCNYCSSSSSYSQFESLVKQLSYLLN